MNDTVPRSRTRRILAWVIPVVAVCSVLLFGFNMGVLWQRHHAPQYGIQVIVPSCKGTTVAYPKNVHVTVMERSGKHCERRPLA